LKVVGAGHWFVAAHIGSVLDDAVAALCCCTSYMAPTPPPIAAASTTEFMRGRVALSDRVATVLRMGYNFIQPCGHSCPCTTA
jgi:hypothetical protein